ncbi:MAG TPA: hypothetical protein PKB04_02835 [Phenylobacterium sp.]|nr:hypothetical protein [Phenylobacterium sp.]
MRVFDKIHVIDLHGNTNKKERSPDGSADKNVFDIMQGVAIVVCSRRAGSSKQLAVIRHSELWGSRQSKNEALGSLCLGSEGWTTLTPSEPRFPLVPTDGKLSHAYSSGVAMDQLFITLGNGIVTKRDQLCIQETAEQVWETMVAFRDEPEELVRKRYRIPADVRDWRYEWAKADVAAHMDPSSIIRINYRPFDERFILYTGNARGFVGWPVKQVMSHYIQGPNLGFLVPKASRDAHFAHSFVTVRPSEAIFLSSTTGSNAMNMPLYFYPETSTQVDAFAPKQRTLNLDAKLYAGLCKAGGIDPADQARPEDEFRTHTGAARPSEVKLFDYIYGILHSPDYRAAYAEFLKIDFPRIPWPASPEVFRHVSEKGEALRRLHLMEPAALGETPYVFDGDGDDVVAAGYPKFTDGRVFINPNQRFEGVPEVAWNFFIGGYQPAQKWLKDRRGRVLSWDDIGHYQRIIKALAETDRVMKEIEFPLA